MTAHDTESDATSEPGGSGIVVKAIGQASATVDRRGAERRVLGLAWPIIGENLLQALLGVVDTWLVAKLGAAAIAGVGTGIQLTFFLISILAAITIGASILVAMATGARDGHQAIRLAKQSLTWSVLLSLPISVVAVILADPLVSVFGVAPDVAIIGADYWRVVAGSSVFLILMLSASAVLRSAGDSRTPMLTTLLANGVNAVVAYGLIFGQLGMPELGPVGSAWAASLGRFIGALVLIAVLIKGRGIVNIRGWGGWQPDWSVARRIFTLGIPAALEQILISLSFVVLMVIIAALGTQALAAQRLAFTALSLAFIPGFGFGIAATALVGQSLGARRPAEAIVVAQIATRWAVIWMTAMGLLYAIFGEQIMRFFTEGDSPVTASVIEFGVVSFRTIALALPFWAIGFVQSGALRGTGDTNYPLRANALGMWASVALAALLVNGLGWGLAGGWGAYVIISPLVALMLWRRFAQHRWQAVT